MRAMKRFLRALPFVLLFAVGCATAAESPTPAVDPVLASFLKPNQFEQMKLSPTGQYIAASIPVEGKTILVVLDRLSMTVTGHFNVEGKTHVKDFSWVNDNRLVISIAQRDGALDTPQYTGELFGMNADGSHTDTLIGYRADAGTAANLFTTRQKTRVAAFMVDPLSGNDEQALISYISFNTGEAPYTTLALMNVMSGQTKDIAHAPVRQADFVIDHAQVARFATGANDDNFLKLYYRKGASDDWQLINDESVSGIQMWCIGFSADDSKAYLQVQEKTGPDAIYSFDPKTGVRARLFADARRDPSDVLYASDGLTPYAVKFDGAPPRVEYLDAASPEAKQLAKLQKAFAGQDVSVTSYSKDGKWALVLVEGGRNSGDFYLLDTVAGQASYQASRRDAVDIKQLAEVRPIQFKARDGVLIDGLLTVPPGSSGKSLRLIVNPHGGPIGIADEWVYNNEAQLLAAHGYAVLQVNYRGSSGYGRQFEEMGYRQWGLAMQDDLTDATHWAVSEGIADAKRICIYGGSYGGYAALMGVAKEPTLYRCAIGYVGVYDLSLMRKVGDIQKRRAGMHFLDLELSNDAADLAAVSPTKLAANIKVPVFLATGGQDERAPQEHSERMRDALKAAGNPPEWLAIRTEGHGFFTEEHRLTFYSQLLDFLDRQIGDKASQ